MVRSRKNGVSLALAPLGIAALIAGCGGGSAVSGPGSSTTVVPPPGRQMSTATLSLLIPGRRPSSGTRGPRYVSPFTSRVDVAAVSAGAPSPWPIATSTSIPTPGPLPSGGASPTPIPVTMTVPVAVGSDQFLVNAYDGGGYLLSGLSTGPVTINANSSNTVNLQLNAAADCVMVNGGVGGAFTTKPFENQTGAQTATFTVTPCDADGYTIPAGQNLANAITFATPAPVSIGVNSNNRQPKGAASGPLSFSPSVITQGGAQTVTVTYPANSNAALSVAVAPSPVPPALYGGYGSVTVDPVFLAFVSNHDSGTISVLSSDAQGTGITPWSPAIGLYPGLYPGIIVGAGPQSGCAQGGQAAVLDTSGPLVLTLATPGPLNPTPAPAWVQGGIGSFIAPATAMAMDTSCNLYIGDSSSPGGYLFSSTSQMGLPLSTFGGPYSAPMGTNPAFSAPITAAAWLNGIVYVGLGATSGYLNNIANASAMALQNTNVAPGTQAMVRYDATTMVVAYQPPPGQFPSDVFLARWDGTQGAKLTTQDLGSNTQYSPVKGMTVDPSGNVWAITAYNLYQYNPTTAFFKSYSLPSPHNCPSAIASAPNGTLFITDTCSSPGSLSMYSSANITGGSLGTTAQALATYPVGNNPSGVVIVP